MNKNYGYNNWQGSKSRPVKWYTPFVSPRDREEMEYLCEIHNIYTPRRTMIRREEHADA